MEGVPISLLNDGGIRVPCTKCQRPTSWGIGIGEGRFEPRCHSCMPEGAMLAKYRDRITKAIRSGDGERAIELLSVLITEAKSVGRRETLTWVNDIVGAHCQDAAHTYSDATATRAAKETAHQIARSIKNA